MEIIQINDGIRESVENFFINNWGAPIIVSKGNVHYIIEHTYQPEQESFIGNQAGGRVFLFLNTDDFLERL